MFIKRGDGKILDVVQDEASEKDRKSTIKKASEQASTVQKPDNTKKSEG